MDLSPSLCPLLSFAFPPLYRALPKHCPLYSLLSIPLHHFPFIQFIIALTTSAEQISPMKWHKTKALSSTLILWVRNSERAQSSGWSPVHNTEAGWLMGYLTPSTDMSLATSSWPGGIRRAGLLTGAPGVSFSAHKAAHKISCLRGNVTLLLKSTHYRVTNPPESNESRQWPQTGLTVTVFFGATCSQLKK